MSETLVQFAGDDLPARQKPSALALFRLGYNTTEIAHRLGVTEAAASRYVYEQRTRLLGLPVEYERRRRA